MDWSLLISLLALGTSVFTYFRHDRKLKKQEQKINNYQIAQMEAAAEENKKANICGDIRKSGNRYILTVSNRGKAIARDIRIEGLNSRHIIHSAEFLLPYSLLNPTESFDITIDRIGGYYIDRLSLVYRWDDDYSNDRTKEQIVMLA